MQIEKCIFKYWLLKYSDSEKVANPLFVITNEIENMLESMGFVTILEINNLSIILYNLAKIQVKVRQFFFLANILQFRIVNNFITYFF